MCYSMTRSNKTAPKKGDKKMKWYNVELTKQDAEIFRVELKKGGIK